MLKRSRLFPFAAVVFALLAALALAGCHGRQTEDSGGLTPVRVQLDWYPQPEHGGFYIAQMLGYYRAEGLDVTLLPLPEYGSAAQLVSTSKADLGLGSSDQILEWDSNGLPLIAIAATMQHDPQAIMVHKDSSIHDFRDLDGHTISAQTGATWLKYVTSRYNLRNVRQVPSTLSIASIRGWQEYLRNPGPTNALLLKLNPALNPAQEAYTAQALYDGGFVTGGSGPGQSADQTGQMTAAGWQASYDRLKLSGIMQGPLDLTTAYTLKFLQ